MNHNNRQKTLKKSITANGIGVHSGQAVQLTLKHAPANAGITFFRTDLSPSTPISAHAKKVVDTRFSSCIGDGDCKISTIEHLMSALCGLGIDNLFVELSGEELPIFDGSATSFVTLLQSAGLTTLDAPRSYLRIIKTVTVDLGDKHATLQPYDGYKVSITCDYDHPVFESQKTASFNPATDCYSKDIAPARTFGFLADYDFLRANNLAQGASLENTIVLDETSVMNQDGLRYPDECVRHKILDAIGDLYLLGFPLMGEFMGYRSGHALNHQLVMALLDNPAAYEIITKTSPF